MKDTVNRLKRRRQRVREQVRFNAEGNNFFENFEIKLRFEIGRKLLRSSLDRYGFLEEAGIKSNFLQLVNNTIQFVCDVYMQNVNEEYILSTKSLFLIYFLFRWRAFIILLL